MSVAATSVGLELMSSGTGAPNSSRPSSTRTRAASKRSPSVSARLSVRRASWNRRQPLRPSKSSARTWRRRSSRSSSRGTSRSAASARISVRIARERSEAPRATSAVDRSSVSSLASSSAAPAIRSQSKIPGPGGRSGMSARGSSSRQAIARNIATSSRSGATCSPLLCG